MHIYLSHPVHGRKVATMELEAKYDETKGWSRYNPDTPSVEVQEAAPVNALVSAPATTQRRRRTVN